MPKRNVGSEYKKKNGKQKNVQDRKKEGNAPRKNSKGKKDLAANGTKGKNDGVSKYRKRILEDTSVVYAYSEKQKIIHQKYCSFVKRIPDKDLFYSDEYMPELKQCNKCAMRSYILAGAKDPANVDKYLQWFSKLQVPVGQVRDMYIKQGMKTKINEEVVTVWDREDTWKLVLLDNKGKNFTVRLLHNNYRAKEAGTRKFEHGFHIQNNFTKSTCFEVALRAIKDYTFEAHVEAELQQREQERAESSQNAPLSLWGRIKQWFVSIGRRKQDSSKFSILLEDFRLVEKVGFPKNGERCIFIWENGINHEKRWQTGIYDKFAKNFTVEYGEKIFVTSQNKVIAWKRIDPKEGIL